MFAVKTHLFPEKQTKKSVLLLRFVTLSHCRRSVGFEFLMENQQLAGNSKRNLWGTIDKVALVLDAAHQLK